MIKKESDGQVSVPRCDRGFGVCRVATVAKGQQEKFFVRFSAGVSIRRPIYHKPRTRGVAR